jgi:hypothetical protein
MASKEIYRQNKWQQRISNHRYSPFLFIACLYADYTQQQNSERKEKLQPFISNDCVVLMSELSGLIYESLKV